MKFKIEKNVLLEGLQRVQNVVSLRSTLPILSNVLLSAKKDSLTLTTTDLDISVQCTIKAQSSKTGATTLPARRLVSIIRELSDANVDIDVDDKDVATIRSGSSEMKLFGLTEDEFPPMPKAEGKQTYVLEQRVLREMLEKTAYAASTDETRYVLNGVLASFKNGKLSVVATDGRRLALVEQDVEFPKDGEGDYILPTKTVNELMHVLGDEGEVKIYVRDNGMLFVFGDNIVSSKLIDGTYPNYKQVIPTQCNERITIERETLLTALKRASLLMTDKSNATKLVFSKNRLTVQTSAPDVGEAKETIPIKYGGKEITVAFNPEYTMDPLKVLEKDEVFLELTDELSPGVMKCDMPFLYVLMPMRIS